MLAWKMLSYDVDNDDDDYDDVLELHGYNFEIKSNKFDFNINFGGCGFECVLFV